MVLPAIVNDSLPPIKTSTRLGFIHSTMLVLKSMLVEFTLLYVWQLFVVLLAIAAVYQFRLYGTFVVIFASIPS